jgi:predicted alpha/beta-hydrolase family hydrolase
MRTARLRVPLLIACLLASPARAAEPAATKLSLDVRGTRCSALLLRPADARALLVLAHGRVMDVQHPFMEAMSVALARHGVATLRFNFPYAEAKRAQPDAQPLLVESIRAAAHAGEQQRGELPLLVGGKSLGAMMAAEAASEGLLGGVQGLVMLGYPLHAPGRPSAVNARPLEAVKQPVLFVEGSQDALADLKLITALVERMGERAKLHVIEGADHSFALPEGDRRTPEEVYDEMASAVAAFVATLAPARGG